jgi:hypothetical protein
MVNRQEDDVGQEVRQGGDGIAYWTTTREGRSST